MAFPLIGAALAVLTPIVKDVVMDVVKDVAMDIGKSFVDTIGKGLKDVASDVLGKGAKILGDVIKNPLDALKDLGKKLIPPQFQMMLSMGQSLMQAATNILQSFLEKMNVNIHISFGGAQGAQAGAQAGGNPQIAGDPMAQGQVAIHNQPQSVHVDHPTQSMTEGQNAISGHHSTGGASSSESGSGKGNFDIYDGRSLAILQQSDPKAFADAYKSLKSPEDKQMAMQNMQNYMQQMNQMMTMMTNMMQIQHDSAKSILNNLRV